MSDGRCQSGAVGDGGAAPPGKGNSSYGGGGPPPGETGDRRLRPRSPVLGHERSSRDAEDETLGEEDLSPVPRPPLPPARKWSFSGNRNAQQLTARRGEATASSGRAADGALGFSGRGGGGGVNGRGSGGGRGFRAGADSSGKSSRGGDGPAAGATPPGGSVQDGGGKQSPPGGMDVGGGGGHVGAGGGATPSLAAGKSTAVEGSVAGDGSARPANIIRIRIPPPQPGQQVGAAGRPSEGKRFSKERDGGPARGSGSFGRSSQIAPASSGRTGASADDFNPNNSNNNNSNNNTLHLHLNLNLNNNNNNNNTASPSDGSDDAAAGPAESFLRDEEAFDEAVSAATGRTGRKKNLVPTRAGGRTRTPSAKYQEFKEVQQVKTINKSRGGGGDSMDVVDYYDEDGSGGGDSSGSPRPQQQQQQQQQQQRQQQLHYSSARQPSTGNGTSPPSGSGASPTEGPPRGKGAGYYTANGAATPAAGAAEAAGAAIIARTPVDWGGASRNPSQQQPQQQQQQQQGRDRLLVEPTAPAARGAPGKPSGRPLGRPPGSGKRPPGRPLGSTNKPRPPGSKPLGRPPGSGKLQGSGRPAGRPPAGRPLGRPPGRPLGSKPLGRPPGKKSGSSSGLVAAGGGGGGGARLTGTGSTAGMGEVAAAAQAARRDRRIDTIVLAKCRRKSQTMWPARLCSKREMLERMENPEPADEGVDPRYMCLVVFLCEGGHHVTDWVTPGSMRPYLRHAAAYPYKKKAYAGTARLQPDFTAAEAWGEEMKALVTVRRGEARALRRQERLKALEETKATLTIEATPSASAAPTAQHAAPAAAQAEGGAGAAGASSFCSSAGSEKGGVPATATGQVSEVKTEMFTSTIEAGSRSSPAAAAVGRAAAKATEVSPMDVGGVGAADKADIPGAAAAAAAASATVRELQSAMPPSPPSSPSLLSQPPPPPPPLSVTNVERAGTGKKSGGAKAVGNGSAAALATAVATAAATDRKAATVTPGEVVAVPTKHEASTLPLPPASGDGRSTITSNGTGDVGAAVAAIGGAGEKGGVGSKREREVEPAGGEAVAEYGKDCGDAGEAEEGPRAKRLAVEGKTRESISATPASVRAAAGPAAATTALPLAASVSAAGSSETTRKSALDQASQEPLAASAAAAAGENVPEGDLPAAATAPSAASAATGTTPGLSAAGVANEEAAGGATADADDSMDEEPEDPPASSSSAAKGVPSPAVAGVLRGSAQAPSPCEPEAAPPASPITPAPAASATGGGSEGKNVPEEVGAVAVPFASPRSPARSSPAAGSGDFRGDTEFLESPTPKPAAAPELATAAGGVAAEGKPKRQRDPPLSPQLVTATSVPGRRPLPPPIGTSDHPERLGGDDDGDDAASLRQPSPTPPRPMAASPCSPSGSGSSAAGAAATAALGDKRPPSPWTVSRPKGPDSPGGGNASSRDGGGGGGDETASRASAPARPPGYGVPGPGFGGYKFNMNPLPRSEDASPPTPRGDLSALR